jgi:hypothetical protein
MRHVSTLSTRSVTVLAVGIVALACGDATGVDPEDLVGTWRASSAIVQNPADPSETADLVAMGLSFTFIFEASGRIETIIEFQDLVERDVGTYSVTDGEFRLDFDGGVSTGTISRRDDMLTMHVRTGAEWDFANDGLDEPATLLLEMQRSR